MSTKRFDSRDLFRVPNLLSFTRLGFAALFPFALQRGPLFALGVLALSGLSDVLDGWWARHFHEESALGATIDGVTDKVFVLAIVVTLLATGTMLPWQAALLATREMGEVLIVGRLLFAGSWRTRRQLKKPHFANIAGKVVTALQYGAVVALILHVTPHVALFWVVITAIAGVIATVSYWTRDITNIEAPIS